MADATVSVGTDKFRLTGGYLYTTFDPFYFYDTPAAAADDVGLFRATQ